MLVALLAQLAAALVVLPLLEADALGSPAWAAHGALAAVAGSLLGLPAWWLPMNFAFVPGALWLQTAALDATWFLLAFASMVAVFWTTYRTRVPLYLSSPRACEAISALLPRDRPFRFVDLGCGFGGVLAALSAQFPHGSFSGCEIAPLPAWVARVRAAVGGRFGARQGDFWTLDLSKCDVIYAFLSPAPMQALWEKVVREARPGTLFISNSFAVPSAEPHSQVPLGGADRGLYVWRI
jgi:SAM-dependent methyltransferase